MIELTALILGLFSWFLLLYCIFKRKHFSQLKIANFQTVSLLLCAIALYLPSLSQQLEFMSNDYDGIIDCVSFFHFASLILLLVTVSLNIALFCIARKPH